MPCGSSQTHCRPGSSGGVSLVTGSMMSVTNEDGITQISLDDTTNDKENASTGRMLNSRTRLPGAEEAEPTKKAAAVHDELGSFEGSKSDTGSVDVEKCCASPDLSCDREYQRPVHPTADSLELEDIPITTAVSPGLVPDRVASKMTPPPMRRRLRDERESPLLLMLEDDDSIISKAITSEDDLDLCNMSASDRTTMGSVTESLLSIPEVALASDEESSRGRRTRVPSFISSGSDEDPQRQRQQHRQAYYYSSATRLGDDGPKQRRVADYYPNTSFYRDSFNRSPPVRPIGPRMMMEANGQPCVRSSQRSLRGRPMMMPSPPPQQAEHWSSEPLEFYRHRQYYAPPTAVHPGQRSRPPWAFVSYGADAAGMDNRLAEQGKREGWTGRDRVMSLGGRDQRQRADSCSSKKQEEEAGRDLSNARNVQGQSPLHLAAAKGFVDGVKILIANGADVNSRDDYGRVPLHAACAASNDAVAAGDVIERLLKAGAEPNAREEENGMTPLHLVAKAGWLGPLEALLRSGAAPSARDTEGDTPLHLATTGGHLKCMEILMAWVSTGGRSTITALIKPMPAIAESTKQQHIYEEEKRPGTWAFSDDNPESSREPLPLEDEKERHYMKVLPLPHDDEGEVPHFTSQQHDEVMTASTTTAPTTTETAELSWPPPPPPPFPAQDLQQQQEDGEENSSKSAFVAVMPQRGAVETRGGTSLESSPSTWYHKTPSTTTNPSGPSEASTFHYDGHNAGSQFQESIGVSEEVGESAGDAGEWVAYTTEDGQVYYYNRVTGASQWDSPHRAEDQPPGSTGQRGGEVVWSLGSTQVAEEEAPAAYVTPPPALFYSPNHQYYPQGEGQQEEEEEEEEEVASYQQQQQAEEWNNSHAMESVSGPAWAPALSQQHQQHQHLEVQYVDDDGALFEDVVVPNDADEDSHQQQQQQGRNPWSSPSPSLPTEGVVAAVATMSTGAAMGGKAPEEGFEEALGEGEEEDPTQRHMAVFDRFLTNALKAAEGRMMQQGQWELGGGPPLDAAVAAGWTPKQRRAAMAWPQALTKDEMAEVMRACRLAKHDTELRRHAVVEAVVAGSRRDVEALLLMGVSPSTCDRVKRTLLHHAVKGGDADMVAAIGVLSVDVDAQDIVGCTPLHVAAEFGRVKALTFLLESAAMVEGSNLERDTPLHLAALGGHLDCCKKLIEYGAETDVTNRHGLNPYYYALRKGGRRRAGASNGSQAPAADPEKLMRTLQYLGRRKGSMDPLEESRVLGAVQRYDDMMAMMQQPSTRRGEGEEGGETSMTAAGGRQAAAAAAWGTEKVAHKAAAAAGSSSLASAYLDVMGGSTGDLLVDKDDQHHLQSRVKDKEGELDGVPFAAGRGAGIGGDDRTPPTAAAEVAATPPAANTSTTTAGPSHHKEQRKSSSSSSSLLWDVASYIGSRLYWGGGGSCGNEDKAGDHEFEAEGQQQEEDPLVCGPPTDAQLDAKYRPATDTMMMKSPPPPAAAEPMPGAATTASSTTPVDDLGTGMSPPPLPSSSSSSVNRYSVGQLPSLIGRSRYVDTFVAVQQQQQPPPYVLQGQRDSPK